MFSGRISRATEEWKIFNSRNEDSFFRDDDDDDGSGGGGRDDDDDDSVNKCPSVCV
jgi:hypothetical protein